MGLFLRASPPMGAYKYLEEIWKKKQSDALRFLLRVRCWEYRQLPAIHRVQHPTRPDKARRLDTKQSKVLLFIAFVFAAVPEKEKLQRVSLTVNLSTKVLLNLNSKEV